MLRVSITLLLLYSCLAFAQKGWQYQQSNTTRNLYGIYSNNKDMAWAVGDSGTIVQTLNGGAVWASMNFNRVTAEQGVLHLTAVWGFSRDTILVSGFVASPMANDTAFIMRTSDGGASWKEVFSQTHSQINQLYFLSSTFGFATTLRSAFGQEQYILKTDDAGLHWTLRKAFPEGDYQLLSCWFPDATLFGYAIKYGAEPWYYYRAYYVQNTTEKEFKARDTASAPIFSLVWCGDSTWLMDSYQDWTTNKKRTIYQTLNAGGNWAQIAGNPAMLGSSQSFAASSLYLIAPHYLDYPVKIFKSTDKGQHWIYQQHPTDVRNLNFIYAVSDSVAYSVGDKGIILKTTDGGGVVTSVAEKEPEVPEDALVYPTPSDGNISLRFPAEEIIVFNIQGVEILRRLPASPQYHFNLAELPNGFFILLARSTSTITMSPICILK